MVYNPANIAKGFFSGIHAAQSEQTRGLNIEKTKKEMLAKEQQKQKGEEISGLLGKFVGDEEGRHEIAGELIGLGTEGVKALQAGSTYIATQDKAKTAKSTAEQKKGGEDLVNAFPYAMNVKDETEWKTQAFPFVADAFIRSGGDPELIRRLNDMPMAEAQEVMAKMWDEEVTQKSGSFKTYQSKKEPEKTYSLNMANPEDVDFLEKNSKDLILAPTREITGKPEDFATDKAADDMAKVEASTSNFLADIYEAQDFVRDNPGALTDVSGLARIGTNLMANVDTLARDFDVEFEDEEVLNAATYAETFKDLGIANAEMKSIMVGLASQQAIINNPSGRISDRDLKVAMQQIGTSIQNPEGFIRITDRLAKRADRVFRSQYKSRSKGNKSFEGDLGLRKVAEVGSKYNFNAMSIEELDGLDVNSMSKSELEAAEKRWNELSGT